MINRLKTLAHSDRLRMIVVAVISGGVNFGLKHSKIEIVFLAIPMSLNIGAMGCVAAGDLLGSVLKLHSKSIVQEPHNGLPLGRKDFH